MGPLLLSLTSPRPATDIVSLQAHPQVSGRPSQTAGGKRKPDAFESQNMDISTEELRNYGPAGGGGGRGLIARQKGLFNSDETRALSLSLSLPPSI